MRTVEISGGVISIVDDADYGEISKHRWSFNGRYAVRWESGRYIRMHRQIIGAMDGQIVDHINWDGLDNRKANLRIATHRQNLMNVGKKNKGASKFKGVSWRGDTNGKKRWRATITVNYRQRYLGLFENERDAAIAYNNAAKELYGEFAYLNPV